MRCVFLVRDLDVEEEIAAAVAAALMRVLGLAVLDGPEFPDARAFHDPRREQYDSSALLVALAAGAPAAGGWILGITGRDLYVPMLTFVFGQAQLAGRVAVVSLARLRQEFYGLPADPGLLRVRAVKEALHEMGHALGLVHCIEPGCAMSLSTQIEQVDAKSADLCVSCRALLREGALRLDETAGGGPA